MPAMIVLGDKTDHGGEVIEASGVTDTHGRRIARVGDKVHCPKKGHGITVITTGDMTMVVDGQPVAYHGCKTSCGATLIASQAITTVNFGNTRASASLAAVQGSAIATTALTHTAPRNAAPSAAVEDAAADQRFVLRDEATGEPLANRLYRMKFRGAVTEGRTDSSGQTSAVSGAVGETVEIEVFAEAAEA